MADQFSAKQQARFNTQPYDNFTLAAQADNCAQNMHARADTYQCSASEKYYVGHRFEKRKKR